jgi:hypothetical protein
MVAKPSAALSGVGFVVETMREHQIQRRLSLSAFRRATRRSVAATLPVFALPVGQHPGTSLRLEYGAAKGQVSVRIDLLPRGMILAR